MQRSGSRPTLDGLDLEEQPAKGITDPLFASLLWALALLGLLLGVDAWSPPDWGEPLPLRWVRVAAEHPIRSFLAFWLLARACVPIAVPISAADEVRPHRGPATGVGEGFGEGSRARVPAHPDPREGLAEGDRQRPSPREEA